MKKLILVSLLCSSCATTVHINGHKTKVPNQLKPGQGYSFTVFVSYGIGEQYRK